MFLSNYCANHSDSDSDFDFDFDFCVLFFYGASFFVFDGITFLGDEQKLR